MEFYGILEEQDLDGQTIEEKHLDGQALYDRIFDASQPLMTLKENIKIFYKLLEEVNSLHS